MGAAAVPLAIGTAGISAFSSASEASRANAANKRALGANNAQADLASRDRRERLGRRWSSYSSALEVSALDRGAAGASSQALARAALFGALEDVRAEKSNAYSAQVSRNAASAAKMQNPFMSGIMGGLQGLQAGLGIAQGFESLSGP